MSFVTVEFAHWETLVSSKYTGTEAIVRVQSCIYI